MENASLLVLLESGLENTKRILRSPRARRSESACCGSARTPGVLQVDGAAEGEKQGRRDVLGRAVQGRSDSEPLRSTLDRDSLVDDFTGKVDSSRPADLCSTPSESEPWAQVMMDRPLLSCAEQRGLKAVSLCLRALLSRLSMQPHKIIRTEYI